MSEFAKWIAETAQAHAEIARIGMRTGEEYAKRHIRTVVGAYQRALEDSNFKCPTYLHAAIEAARRYADESSVNCYANATIKRDQEQSQWERDSKTGAREQE